MFYNSWNYHICEGYYSQQRKGPKGKVHLTAQWRKGTWLGYIHFFSCLECLFRVHCLCTSIISIFIQVPPPPWSGYSTNIWLTQAGGRRVGNDGIFKGNWRSIDHMCQFLNRWISQLSWVFSISVRAVWVKGVGALFYFD